MSANIIGKERCEQDTIRRKLMVVAASLVVGCAFAIQEPATVQQDWAFVAAVAYGEKEQTLFYARAAEKLADGNVRVWVKRVDSVSHEENSFRQIYDCQGKNDTIASFRIPELIPFPSHSVAESIETAICKS
jgi:hypothetical protein